MWFELFVFGASVFAAAVAAVAGFGIGSLLTPSIGIVVEPKIAVAAVSIPHFIGTALRFSLMKDAVDRRVLWRFGIASAIGGLTGALLHSWLDSPWLAVMFGVVLIFVAISEATGLARRMTFHGPVAWLAGAFSGLLGGLVGNQGGIRSAALLGFDVPKRTFVATATAVGLMVDAARMPVYVATVGPEMIAIWPVVLVSIAGVIVGTLYGGRILARVPESRFRPLVALLLTFLGMTMLVQGVRGIY